MPWPTSSAPPPEGSESVIARSLQAWEPVIADIATRQAGQQPPPELRWFLAEQAKNPDWSALVAVPRRILAGERGETLLDGLDPIDTVIARETLARLNRDR